MTLTRTETALRRTRAIATTMIRVRRLGGLRLVEMMLTKIVMEETYRVMKWIKTVTAFHRPKETVMI